MSRADGRTVLDYLINNCEKYKYDFDSPCYLNKLGNHWIKLDNNLFSDPNFESGVCKIQSGNEDRLTILEIEACKPLRKNEICEMIEPARIVHGLEQVMMDKKRKLESMEKGESKYEAAYILSSAAYVEQH